MITFMGVLVGLPLMVVGVLILWKYNVLRQYVGDISFILDFPQAKWLDWPFIGAGLAFVGLFIMLGLFQTIMGNLLGFFIAPKV